MKSLLSGDLMDRAFAYTPSEGEKLAIEGLKIMFRHLLRRPRKPRRSKIVYGCIHAGATDNP